ncbi:MAG: CAP domain-containing protein [Planctomycetaceae bacterium]
MRTSPRIVLIVALVVALLLAADGQSYAGTRAARTRHKLLGFVNDFRRSEGLPVLKIDLVLSKFAWHHSLKMARERSLFHSTLLGTKVKQRGGSTWGENVGMGGSLWSVFAAWKKSAPHLRNLKYRRFRHAGIGVVYAHGAYWITLDLYGG